jgi:hypothetical protein
MEVAAAAGKRERCRVMMFSFFGEQVMVVRGYIAYRLGHVRRRLFLPTLRSIASLSPPTTLSPVFLKLAALSAFGGFCK